jgi:hypothetical protein
MDQMVDVEKMNQFFVTRRLRQNELDFDIPVKLGVPEILFIPVDSKEVFDAFMTVKLDASGLDRIRMDSLSFVKILLPVVLPDLTQFLLISFSRASRWKCAVVLPIPKVSNPVGFSDFCPISLLPCLFIRNFGLLYPFNKSGFRRHHSIATAVLKGTEDI